MTLNTQELNAAYEAYKANPDNAADLFAVCTETAKRIVNGRIWGNDLQFDRDAIVADIVMDAFVALPNMPPDRIFAFWFSSLDYAALEADALTDIANNQVRELCYDARYADQWAQRVATGALSRHDAAVQLAILHASDYAKQLAELDREEENDRQRSTLTDDERATRKNGRDIRRTELLSKQDITAAQDGVNIVAATWQGALRNANAAFVQDSRDTAKQVAEVYQQALSGLNENLSNLMFGDKSNFSGMFKGIGKTLANDSLKQIESPILGALGLGKADGSASNPFSVKVVGGDFNSGLKSGLAGIFGGDGKDESKPAGVGGFFGSLIGGLFGGSFQHRALGGSVKAGVPVDVGELGRETFVPSVDGTIIPHNKTSGNVAYYTVNVANGVTPEQMNMHVSSALQQFHPQVVRDSVKAVTANRARNPASSRS